MPWTFYTTTGQPMIQYAANPLTTKGDIITFGTGITRLAVGANNTCIVANTAAATGLSWAADQFRYLGTRVITANQTYTTAANCRAIQVCALGAGGAGGGAFGSIANVAVGSGGGAGAYAEKWITAPNTTYVIVVGIAGVGVTAANGGNGSNTTFGATVLVAQGGVGGIANANAITTLYQQGGAGAPVATGGDINIGGDTGGIAQRLGANNTQFISGSGASSPYGSGGAGRCSTTGAGNNATGFGAGGGGAASNTAVTQVGGNGTAGLIIVYEYA